MKVDDEPQPRYLAIFGLLFLALAFGMGIAAYGPYHGPGLLFGILVAALGAGLLLRWHQQTVEVLRAREARYRTLEAALHEREQQARALVATLNAEQVRFAKVADTIPGVICTFRLRPEGVLSIPYASKAFEDIFGLTLADVAESIDALIARVPPEDAATLESAVAESARTMQPWHNEYRYRHPLKGDIWVEGYSIPVREEDGITVWYGLSTDITERKRAEKQLWQSEVRFRALIEHAPGAITLVGADGKLKFISASSERVMGYRPEDMFGADPAGLTHPDDLPALLELLYELMQIPDQVRMTHYRFRHHDGSWRWVESTISNLLHEPSVNAIAMNFHDITERKQAELALRASEEQYRGLMESLDSMVATVDAAGTFLYMNDLAAQGLGGTPQQFIGKTMQDLFPGPVAVSQMRNIRKVIHDDTKVIHEAMSIVLGQPRWYRTTIQPIHDETGRVIYGLINATDIHDLKAAQQELLDLNRTLEERVQQRTAEVQDLYDHAPTGYHSLDADGRLLRVNQTELDWLGYSREALIGRPLVDLITPASRANFPADFARFKEQGRLQNIELELIRKDGSIIPVLISATAIYDEAGHYVMSRSTAFDITQRKAAELALRESEAQNRLLFEASPDAIVLFDASGGVVRMNHAFEIMTGYRGEQLTGQRLDARGLLAAEERAPFAAVIEQARQSDNFAATELQITSAAGDTRDVGARVFGLQIRGAQHYLATLRDITAEKQVEATLRRANTELARAARSKDEFLANMSHELRTPINAVLAFSESLQEQIYGPLSPRQHDALRNIELGGRHLLALINDILDLAKVEAGQLALQIDQASIGDVCQASLMFVRELALKKSLLLEFHLSDQLATMDVDPKRLKQMLVNLLSNAVKFTPDRGRVRLDVTVDVAAGAARFAVEDSGIGIAPEDMGRLFQPFSQLDSSLSRQHEGTGLGLALVHRLTELHGGSISVESEVGVGSRFTIALPYRPPQQPNLAQPSEADRAPTDAAVAEPGPTGALVLLAEDNEDSIEVIGEYLRAKGYSLAVARNGLEALAQAEAARPELILMDIQMPKLDGLEAIRRLRARPDTAATPIIALTALAMPGDRERCLEAGASAYMTKPVSLRDLVATMQRLGG